MKDEPTVRGLRVTSLIPARIVMIHHITEKRQRTYLQKVTQSLDAEAAVSSSGSLLMAIR